MEKQLDRFTKEQQHSYHQALREIGNWKKTGHWMWYIFPQLLGLGHSETARHFAIRDAKEATAYLAHPTLGKRLTEISCTLLELAESDAREIFGTIDALKLRSSMTLFALQQQADPVFEKVLYKFFAGKKDPQTLALLNFPEVEE